MFPEVELRVLGPLEVVEGDNRLALGGPKQRVALAVLVSNAGERVSVGALIDAIYGDEAPDRAHRSIHTFISNLRGIVGDVIERRGDGYAFTGSRALVDASVFEDTFARATESGDARDRSALLRRALALWRGHPYDDVEAHGALQIEATRLNELRIAALEAAIQADLDLGRDRELVGQLEALTTEYPLNERLRGLQMLTLYRAGRATEAVRAFARARGDFVDLGLEPSADLRALEQRILDQDPTLLLEAPPTVRAVSVLVADVADADQLSSLAPGERHQLISTQAAALDDAVTSHRGVVFAQRGSALFAWFSETADSAAAAVAAQSTTKQWLPRLRVAIATGEVEDLGADQVVGPPLTRCSAMVAVAHGGQVLLSSDAFEALGRSGRPGFRVRSLGPHEITGLEPDERVYQLDVDGDVDEFPPLRVGRTPPTLPTADRGVAGYELREKLGSGPSADVHRAYQPSIGREVAIKVIRPELANDTAYLCRFEVEAQLVARLEHPNIVPLYDYWRDPDGAYLVMRWMRGGSLASRLEHGLLTTDEVDALVRSVGSALEHAHRNGIAHGAVMPSNVLFDAEGDICLSDFGLTASLDPMADWRARDVRQLAQLVDRCASFDEGIDRLLTRATASPGLPSAAAFVDSWSEALGRSRDRQVRFTPTPNPYKGLHAFGELDAGDFHGRDDTTRQLIDAVRQRRLVAVVGPSGVGKSSVVRAGLVAAIRSDAIKGSALWLVTDMLPGAHPYEALTSALLRVASRHAAALDDELRRDARGLVRAATRYLPERSTLLLVVDQFEELFTLADGQERADFLDLLAATVHDTRSGIRIVLTIRADFFDRPLGVGEFGDLLRDATVPIAAPTRDAMREIIEQPALDAGVSFEPGLVDRILADVDHQPGALPLLEYSLTELFSRRSTDRLTADSYAQAGGVLGALGHRAESIYQSLHEREQAVTRQVFLRLVRVEETGRDTRRRARQAELSRLDIDRAVLAKILGAFGDHRLLTFDRDPITRGPTVEVAHEALLERWSRLRQWVDDRREHLLLQRSLTVALEEWEHADRSDTYLLTGGRLSQHREWSAMTDLTLSAPEREYLEASVSHEAKLRSSARRRRRLVLAGFAVAAIVASIFAVTSTRNAREAAENAEQAQLNANEAAENAEQAQLNADEADRNAEAAAQSATQAEVSAAVAGARRLAASAISVLDEDPELSILLTLQAIASTPQGDEQPTEVIDALWRAVQQDRLVEVIDTGSADGVAVTLSPDESTLYAVVGEPTRSSPVERLAVRAYSTSTSELLWEYEGNPGDRRVAGTDGDDAFLLFHVSPDGTRLALQVVSRIPRMVILDSADGSEIQTVTFPACGFTPNPWGWTPDGSRFAVTGDCARDGVGQGWLEILDGESFESIRLIDTPGPWVPGVSIDDSGRLYVDAGEAPVSVYEPPEYASGVTLEGAIGSGDVSPDGSRLVLFSRPAACLRNRSLQSDLADCGILATHDATTGERIDVLQPLPAAPAGIGLVSVFSDNDRLAAVATDGAETLVWDVTSGEQVFRLPSGPSNNAVLTSDGRTLYTGHNGGFKKWDLGPNVGLEALGDLGSNQAISVDTIAAGDTIGAFVAVGLADFGPHVFFFDLATGAFAGQPVVGQQPVTALADDRFVITDPIADARVASSWSLYTPQTGDRTQLASCEIDAASRVCLALPGGTYDFVVSDDGSELLRQGDGQFALIDPDTGAVIGRLTSQLGIETVDAFSDDLIMGSLDLPGVATATINQPFVVEDRSTGDLLLRIERITPDVVRSPDGTLLAFDLGDAIQMVDLSSMQEWTFPVELGRVQGMAIDPESERIALGDENGIHVFETDSGTSITSIPLPLMADVHWMADDRLLVATRTGTWAALSLATDDLIASATERLQRGLTADECRTYRIDPCPTLEQLRSPS